MLWLKEERLAEKLELRLKEDIAKNNLFGAALYVYQEDNLELQITEGISNPESLSPVTSKTVFRLASMTKPVAVCTALRLWESGELSLDATVDQYLDNFHDLHLAYVDSKGNLLAGGSCGVVPTVRQLLSHTSGVGSGMVGAAQLRRMTPADKESISNTVQYFSKAGLSYVPGTKQEYSGYPAYDVLGAIIEKISGEDLYGFMKREILDKCDMPDTAFIPVESQLARMNAMHDRVNGCSTTVAMQEGAIFEDIPWSHSLAGAGLVSTLADYAHFARMLLQKGTYQGKQVLTSDSIRELSRPQVPESISMGLYRWGLGVRVIVSSEYKYLPVGAFGWSGAYGTHFWVDPINRITCVYLKNSKFDPGAGSVTGYNFEEDVYTSL